MATKEDILEQIAEEYLIHKGYFVQHNIKFLPRKDHPDFVKRQDSNHSDLDVLGYNPNLQGPESVYAVSCKSWQSGFRPSSEIDAIKQNKTVRGREAWKSFRELCKPKWSEAFVQAVMDATGTDEFTHVLAVTRVIGEKSIWEEYESFQQAIRGNPLKILTFGEMVSEIRSNLGTTLAATEVGRLIQLLQAAKIEIK